MVRLDVLHAKRIRYGRRSWTSTSEISKSISAGDSWDVVQERLHKKRDGR